MKVHGRCHCGAVAYEAEVDPTRVSICHCTDCQQLTGTAYRVSVPTRREDLVLVAGEPRTYLKTSAESGRPRVQAFCATCGSPLWARAVGDDFETYGLRVGCLDERRELPPRRRIWCRSAMPWSLRIDDVPAHERE
jgi:hypothetical protein